MPYPDIYIDDSTAVSRTREEAPSLIERAACAGVEMLKFGAGRQTVLVRSERSRSTIRGRGSHMQVQKSLISGSGGKQSSLANMGYGGGSTQNVANRCIESIRDAFAQADT